MEVKENPDQFKMNFIVIDDSKVDCFIAEKVIQNSGWCSSCHTFQLAAEALEYICKKDKESPPTVIFVDEHMPLMSGLDFVKAFNELAIIDKNNYHIFLLSSSLYGARETVPGQAVIKKLIRKPLMTKTINDLVNLDLKFLFQ